jgi:hypothetical protein
MGYQTHPYESKKHPFAKRTNLQYSGDAQDMTDRAYDRSFPTRALRSWERAELRQHCEANGIPEPEAYTLDVYTRILGRSPQILEDGQWKDA